MEVHWLETGSDSTDSPMLRAIFPLAIENPRFFSQVPFDVVERAVDGKIDGKTVSYPFSQSTIYGVTPEMDDGQEVPAQKWVDLSNGVKGVALLNKTKYGHSYHNGELRLTLMRAAGSPDIYPNLGSGIQMRSGRLIVPATQRTVDKTQSFALYSDDNGAEWHAGEVVEAAVNEAQIVELNDGRLLMSVRPNSGGDRLVAWSSDGGEHWTKPAPLFSSTRVAEAIECYTRAGENDAQRNRLLHTIPAGGS